MNSLAFLTAVYNEEDEIIDLIHSVRPFVDTIVVSDDGSTDETVARAIWTQEVDVLVLGPHLASCEEIRLRGIRRVTERWVLILDADERIDVEGMLAIGEFINSPESSDYTHVYFSQDEYIDGVLTRSFSKIKLARTAYINLPVGIHEDISCPGNPIDLGIKVLHRKTLAKQIMRESEYLDAYQRKIREGKMTPERAAQVAQWHYVVKEK
jgi:glycosyltransferase involved in cell wall biosynthesis